MEEDMKEEFFPKYTKTDILKKKFITSKSIYSRGSTVDLLFFDLFS